MTAILLDEGENDVAVSEPVSPRFGEVAPLGDNNVLFRTNLTIRF